MWTIVWSDRWVARTGERLLQDLRHAARALRRAPAFSATVIVMLALGIGASSAMFTVVDRLMFRPLAHLRDPSSAHRLYIQWQNRGETVTGTTIPYARYLDLRNETTSFSLIAGFSERDVAVGEGESIRERRVGAVSATFFAFFDARPPLGRFFVEVEDATPRGDDVAVLSYDYWQVAFGGRNVLGDRLQVGDIRATIIGVAPEGFNGVNDANPPDVFVPITTYAGSAATNDAKTYYTTYSWGWMNVVARRKPGVSVAEAEADASRALAVSWTTAGGLRRR